jgi:hypothetical protein
MSVGQIKEGSTSSQDIRYDPYGCIRGSEGEFESEREFFGYVGGRYVWGLGLYHLGARW